MKVYEVMRTPDGDVMAFVDGAPLHHVVAHSPGGFAFGRGAGAADLALSILADHFGERPTTSQLPGSTFHCLTYHQDFQWAHITPATSAGSLRLTSADIAGWLAEQDSRRPAVG